MPDTGLNDGSKGDDGAPAKDAEGNKPREPGMTLVSSERLHKDYQARPGNAQGTYMSPNMFSVRMTPFSFLGLPTTTIAAVSMK